MKSTEEKIELGEWQLCPKCNGEGQCVNIGVSSSVFRTCLVCNGFKLLAKPVAGTLITFDREPIKLSDEAIKEAMEVMKIQPMTFVNSEPDEDALIEKWSNKLLKVMEQKLLEESEYIFGLTHFDIMYRATYNEKYLAEKEEYKKKHGR